MFIHWLASGIQQKNIPTNVRGAMVHGVDEGILIICPKAFKAFDKSHWEDISESFLKMGIHELSSEQPYFKYVVSDNAGVFLNGIIIATKQLKLDNFHRNNSLELIK